MEKEKIKCLSLDELVQSGEFITGIRSAFYWGFYELGMREGWFRPCSETLAIVMPYLTHAAAVKKGGEVYVSISGYGSDKLQIGLWEKKPIIYGKQRGYPYWYDAFDGEADDGSGYGLSCIVESKIQSKWGYAIVSRIMAAGGELVEEYFPSEEVNPVTESDTHIGFKMPTLILKVKPTTEAPHPVGWKPPVSSGGA